MSSLLPDEYLPYLNLLPDIHKVANLFMTFTPVFSYGTTCWGIYRKQTSMGFSIDICATMLMASILRINYYVISPYEVTLLRQSIMMVLSQCVLLKVLLAYRPANYDPDFLTPMPVFRNELNAFMPRRMSASFPAEHESYYVDNSLTKSAQLIINDIVKWSKCYVITIFNQSLKFFDVYYQRPLRFWQWKEEQYYWRFLAQFVVVFAVLTAVFHNSTPYGQFVGILGLFIESLLPLPQILLLNRLQSVKNFKIILLLSWLGGDCIKLSYLFFGAENVSIIFIFAGLFQMSLDIYIAFQYVHYKYHGTDSDILEVVSSGSRDLNYLVEELVKHDVESIPMAQMV